MNKIDHLILMLILLTVIYGCKKAESPKIELEAVSGYCYRYDINRIKSADHEGLRISTHGDSISTTTTSDGRWDMSNLKTGIYTFTFSNPGFGTMKVFGKNLIGGYQTIDDVSLYPVPLYTVSLTADSVSADGFGLYLCGIFSGPVPKDPCLHLFFGKNQNVSSDPFTYTYDYALNIGGAMENIEFEVVFLAELFTNNGFNPGDTVYVGAYTDCLLATSYNSDARIFYLDPITDKRIYPNLNPLKSNVLKAVLH